MKLFTRCIVILCFVLVIASLFSATDHFGPGAASTILQSKDGGLTWEDMGTGLPDNSLPEYFLAGESDVYMRVNNVMYRMKRDLKTPVWQKVNETDAKGDSIAFNSSEVKAASYQGQIFQKERPEDGAWLPVFTDAREHSLRSAFDTADGSVFLGYRYGLYKSVDNGQSWTRIPRDGQIMGAKDVFVMQSIKKVGKYLLVGHPDGIFRSSDMGKTWTKVHSSVDGKDYIHINNSSIEERKEVFGIYVSGDVVYAVAHSGKGC